MKLKVAKVFKEFLTCQNKHAVLYGGAGSGKSYTAAQKIIIRTLSETPHRFLVVRKVAKTLRISVFNLLKKIISDLDLDSEFKINETNMSFECKLNGNQIILSGLDDREKLKSIFDITGIWAEEATDLERKDYEQLNLRLRGKTANYKQIISTFNPVSAENWVKKYFIDEPPTDDMYVLKTTYLDNPFIDEEYEKTMREIKKTNPHYYKIYALGGWGTLEGLIYEDYETVDEMPEYFEDEFIGIDFGYNHPFAIVHIRIDKRDLYVDELFYDRKWDNPKVVEWALKNIPWAKRIRGFGDSARPDLISEWQDAGFDIQKANKSVFEGINTVKSFNIHITKRSTNIRKEIGLYVWKTDKNEKSLDEPLKANDDAMDAIRYSLTPYIKKSGKTKSFKLEWL